MKQMFFTFSIICCASLSITAQDWVDMGTYTADGDKILWSSKDLIISDYGVKFASEYEIGSTVGWGDISGKSTSLTGCGGNNPPYNIAGNPQYDIVTALLGDGYRLPTLYDFKEFRDNCTASSEISNRGIVVNGLPTWVQGQWLTNDAMYLGGKVVNRSVSLKIDGHLASIITNNGYSWDEWEGAYSYKNGVIHVGDLLLKVDERNKRLVSSDNKASFYKVSSNAVSGTSETVRMKSKITGNELVFVMPRKMTQLSNGSAVMAWENNQKRQYWLGDLYEKDKDYAQTICIDGYNQEIYPSYVKRNGGKYYEGGVCVRPVKVIKGYGNALRHDALIKDLKDKANRNLLLAQEMSDNNKKNFQDDISYSKDLLSKSDLKKYSIDELKKMQQKIDDEYDVLLEKNIVDENKKNKRKRIGKTILKVVAGVLCWPTLFFWNKW